MHECVHIIVSGAQAIIICHCGISKASGIVYHYILDSCPIVYVPPV